MSDPTPGSGSQTAEKPAVASVDIKTVVAEALAALQPEVAKMVTGAVKRVTAEEITAKMEALKGNADAPKDGDKDKKLTPAEVQLAEVKRQVETLTKESQTYKSRALRSEVAKAVLSANVTTDVTDLLTDKFAGIVTEGEDGKLYVKEADTLRPFNEYLSGFLKDRKGLVKASVREGSGAGQSSDWSEPMPKTKRELLYHPTEKDVYGKAKDTPGRAAQFKAKYPEVWATLPG